MPKPIIDIQCENFDAYFVRQMQNISESGKKVIPESILFTIFRRAGGVNYKKSVSLNVLGKLVGLVASGKNIFIVAEDPVNGMSIDEFHKISKLRKSKIDVPDAANKITANAAFILASKELMETLGFIHSINISPAYNYINQVKNVPKNRTAIWKDKVLAISRFVAHYEGNKKEWAKIKNLSMGEYLTMLALYSNNAPMTSPQIWNGIFRNAYAASMNSIKAAFRTLQERKYLIKHGDKSGATMSLTPLGISVFEDIMSQYVINY